MLNALHYLHTELQVIHRDVKPSNILLNRNGAVKICDFGISGKLVNSVAKSQVGAQLYMAVSVFVFIYCIASIWLCEIKTKLFSISHASLIFAA